MSEDFSPIDIRKICALGAGTMGIGTAVDYAREGYDVALYVREDAGGDEAHNAVKRRGVTDKISSLLEDMAQYDLIYEASIPGIAGRIKVTGNLHEAAADADVVMESIKEETTAKQKIFQRLDTLCPLHTIFATNTSALNPTEIASLLSDRRRQQFIVLHGFNPPHLMPLVEVAPGERTSHDTIRTATHLLQHIGKRPVRLEKATPGFIVNYIQSAIIWSALKLHVEHKINPAEIDGEFKEVFGQSYEILGLLEMAGHETGHLSHIKADVALAGHDEGLVRINSIAGKVHHAAVRAALEIVAKGTASAREVDYAFIHSLGRRYRETGPLESADMGGLDIFQSIFGTLGYLEQPSAVGEWLEEHVGRRETGTKSASKKGIYVWTPEMIADVGGRRKARLVKFLQEDQAGRPAAQYTRQREFIRHDKIS